MAEIKDEGLARLMLDMQAIEDIPEEIKDEMLRAKAEIVAAAQRDQITQLRIVRSGALLRSIKIGRPKTQKGVRVLYVNASGTRTRGGKRKPPVKTRNVEIAFLNEYGTKKQRARPFIKRAGEASADRATEAAAAVYDRWLKSKNL